MAFCYTEKKPPRTVQFTVRGGLYICYLSFAFLLIHDIENISGNHMIIH